MSSIKDYRYLIRVGFLLVLVANASFVGYAAITDTSADENAAPPPQIKGQYDGRTVVTAHADTEQSKIVVYGSDGQVEYLNTTYDRYFDVDPYPPERNSLTYTAAEHVYGSPCGVDASCSRNVIEKLNLTTGETEVVFERYRPRVLRGRWHDADRLGQNRWVIGDIVNDRVIAVNTTTGTTEWTWSAQSHFSLTTGHDYPRDWTHINDLEVLADERVMVNVRNQDQVVFLNPKTGVQEIWTLGEENNYDILNEQHNPDYIPSDRGGPAILVADSHNNRIVEYQRENDEWVQSWTWADTRMQWPRDADRLPNGNTLITDSNGNRIMEIAPNGSVLWSVTVTTPYEAERLGTGDESTNGTAAAALGLPSKQASETVSTEETGKFQGSILRQGVLFVRGLLPSLLVNAILYVLPPWVHFTELAAIGVSMITVLVWTITEYRLSSIHISFTWPIRMSR